MKVIARIKNEKGEEQKFQGETPSQVVKDLVQKTNLKGDFFFISLALKRFLRKDIPIIKSGRLDNEDLAVALQVFLKKANCLECRFLPICEMKSRII